MKKFKRVVITSVVQGMSLNEEALKSLRTFCKEKDARLIVVPIKYRAKGYGTGDEIPFFIQGIDSKEILNRNLLINGHTIVYASVKVRPTAKRPLTGFAGFGGSSSVVIPHPKVGMDLEPSSKKHQPKQLWTSGTISNPDGYSITRAGSEGEFHHTLGAILVEGDFIRHLPISKSGKVYDLDNVYLPDGEVEDPQIAGLVLGDIHMAFQKKKTLKKIISTLKRFTPKHVMLHDLLDANAVSHHNIGRRFAQLGVHNRAMPIDKEIKLCYKFIDNILKLGIQPVLVDSNHINHFTQWLERAVWSDNMRLAVEILEWQLMMVQAIKETDFNLKTPEAFSILIEGRYGKKVKIVGGQGKPSFKIEGYLVDRHGHEGLNGGRGLTGIHRRSADKFITGHTHSPKIIDGLTTVGTYSPLDMPYTGGLSTWGKAFALIYEGGRRQLVLEKPDFGFEDTDPSLIQTDYLSENDEIAENVIPEKEEVLTKLTGRYSVMRSSEPGITYVIHGMNDLKSLKDVPGRRALDRLKRDGVLIFNDEEWEFRLN